MGGNTSKKIKVDRAKVILDSFNKEIYNSMMDSIQGCVGIGGITRNILQTHGSTFRRGEKITKLTMQQEMVLIKECIGDNNFKNRLKMNLNNTIYKQINLINEVKHKNRILSLITHFDINKTIDNRASMVPLKLAVKNIRDLLSTKPQGELNNKTKEEISIIMEKGIRDFTNKVDIIAKVRQELKEGESISLETFTNIGYSSCIPIYTFLLILIVAILVYKIQFEVHLETTSDVTK